MADSAAAFSEEDLTRYLQITLDLFKDLQFSLQPRLHLELGLLRLVQAGKLMSVEAALSLIKGGSPAPAPPAPPRTTPPPVRTGPSPFARDTAKKISAPPAPAPAPATAPEMTDWRSALHAALTKAGSAHTADAVEHADVKFTGTELVFTTSRLYGMAIGGDPEVQKIAEQIAARPVKITVKQGEVTTGASLNPPAPQDDAELTERALSHPDVKRFRELFPDANIRDVRNLKD